MIKVGDIVKIIGSPYDAINHADEKGKVIEITNENIPLITVDLGEEKFFRYYTGFTWFLLKENK